MLRPDANLKCFRSEAFADRAGGRHDGDLKTGLQARFADRDDRPICFQWRLLLSSSSAAVSNDLASSGSIWI
jgi:hypothetical protein